VASHRATRQRWATTILLAAALVLLNGHGARSVTGDFPDSMAAIGDSITQAAFMDAAHIGRSNPGSSWSTGNDDGDGISSHYERVLARNANIAGRNFNHSVSGAKMRDAPAQAAAAVQQGAEYVTVLMGGNDVCASSKGTMTSASAYEDAFRKAMVTLTTGLPTARIYVVSVPDVYQLWSVLKGNLLAVLTWDTLKICQSMLARSNTEADRQFVRTRNIDYNGVLRRVCAEYLQCRYDDDRVFNYRFTAADVSMVDYFHPSAAGQRNLAEITWGAGYWPGQ
jgi:lysophospholipase L1-like esterase